MSIFRGCSFSPHVLDGFAVEPKADWDAYSRFLLSGTTLTESWRTPAVTLESTLGASATPWCRASVSPEAGSFKLWSFFFICVCVAFVTSFFIICKFQTYTYATASRQSHLGMPLISLALARLFCKRHRPSLVRRRHCICVATACLHYYLLVLVLLLSLYTTHSHRPGRSLYADSFSSSASLLRYHIC